MTPSKASSEKNSIQTLVGMCFIPVESLDSLPRRSRGELMLGM
jgi:hypothetical protein